jgi:hypothetical protein
MTESKNEYQKTVDRVQRTMMDSSGNLVQLASANGLIRSNAYFCKLEKDLSFIDYTLLMKMLGFTSVTHTVQWCSKVHRIITSFIYPLRRFVNFLADDDCQITYPSMWRLLKNFNIQGLNPTNASYFAIKSGKIEVLLTKVAKYLHERHDPFEVPKEKPAGLSTLGALKGMLSGGSKAESKPKAMPFGMGSVKVGETPTNPDKVVKTTSGMSLQESLLKKVSISAGVKKIPIKIKEHLLPKEPDACETLLDRRLMYDLTMSVREAMAVLIVFVFDIHLNDLLEYFLSFSETEGILIMEDR